MFELAAATDAVDARHRAAQHAQVFFRFQIRRVTALTREQREAIAFVLQQRFAGLGAQRRDARQFCFGEFGEEGVLFGDRRVGQALRPIELRDDLAAVFQADLIDAVFVTVEREQMTVAMETECLDRGEDLVRRKIRVRGFVADVAHGAA